jgi:hypothetical protein
MLDGSPYHLLTGYFRRSSSTSQTRLQVSGFVAQAFPQPGSLAHTTLVDLAGLGGLPSRCRGTSLRIHLDWICRTYFSLHILHTLHTSYLSLLFSHHV